MADKCKRCVLLERRLRALMGRELELARNSYAVGERLTNEAWKEADPRGYKEYKRCEKVMSR